MNDWLKTIRENSGYNQEKCAEELGITQQMLSAIEIETRRPSVALAKKIADCLNFEKYGYDWTKFYDDAPPKRTT